jgi:plasmid stabilization system protein ParE
MMVKLSRRATLDLAEIADYSLTRWGQRVADEYLDGFDSALEMLAASPDLLRDIPELSGALKWYRVNQHYLICVVIEPVIYVVTIQHGSMDIPNRLLELEPTLQREVEILHATFLHRLPQ